MLNGDVFFTRAWQHLVSAIDVLDDEQQLLALASPTARRAPARPHQALFDFKKPAFKPPPLPTPTVDLQKLADCIAPYPDDGGVGFSPDMGPQP